MDRMETVVDKAKRVLQSYDIDHANGFLRSKPPLRSIPLEKYPKYAIWEEIIAELPHLIIAQSFKRRLESSMPVISDISDLLSASLDVKRRAITILSFFANAFMNETQIVDYKKPKIKPKPRQHLPKCIAIPLYQLCKDMNCPPIIRHCHLVLNNWRLLFPETTDFNQRHKVDDIALNNLFLGGIDESWFFMIGFGIESHSGSTLTSILSIQEYVQMIRNNNNGIDGVVDNIKHHLLQISVHIDAMSDLLLRYYEKLDGHIFYRRVRIFLTGCESKEDFPFGVELRGVDESEIALIGTEKIKNRDSNYLCLRYNGASAAQSAVFPVLDNFLSVDQSQDEFLKHMALYIPFEHRQFIHWMKEERLQHDGMH